MKQILVALAIQLVAGRCENTDDMDLCESSGDYDYSGDGADVTFTNKQPRTTEQTPSQTGPDSPEMAESGIFNLLRGKKFLAAVVTGSSIGLLLAAFAMCLVLWRARKDANIRRYGYQKGKSDSNFP